MNIGYRVSVTSWENDGDNYQTLSVDGLTKEEARAIVEVAQLFESRHGKDKGFGNYYDDVPEGMWKQVTESAEDILSKHDVVESLSHRFGLDLDGDAPEDEDESDDYYRYTNGVRSFISKILGDGEFATRVFESAEIEYITAPSRPVSMKELYE